ncbi:MAG: DNA alkylation repair protein [Verrucomicrobiota bacterium JB025]|nr:DNA alkylation repair protein [Verrucomicrobiota bacterium JB025]
MEPFKNAFDYRNALRIGRAIKAAHPDFSLPAFRRGLEDALGTRELKDRMRLLADRIEAGLPGDPRVLFPILTRALGDETSGLGGFAVWPLTEIVARRGLDHHHAAMDALESMTCRFTAEFAIRSFIRAKPEPTFRQLHHWCGHPSEHVRRLVTEGSRPLLPWGGRLPELLAPPFPTIDLLEHLHRDPSDYVRLSVSNHLNDFSKSHPGLVLETLARWLDQSPGDPAQQKLARHACRTLFKQGHPGALKLHGYGSPDSLETSAIQLETPSVKLGGKLPWQLSIRNRSQQPVLVMCDYAIHFMKANGALKPKVFKGRTRELAPGETWHVSGAHPFRPVTTRVHYPGTHRIEPLVNGRAHPAADFQLVL